jgi:hypothetical protein
MRNEGSRHSSAYVLFALGVSLLLAATAEAQQWATSGSNIYNTNTGNVGIGTIAPLGKLQVSATNPYLYLTSPAPASAAVFSCSAGDNSSAVSGMAVYTKYSLLGSDTTSNWLLGLFGSRSFTIRDVGANATRITIDLNGNVGIGTSTPTAKFEVAGSIKATTVIGAVYQDLAEWVPAGNDIPAGTVVVVDRTRENGVVPSSGPYDTAVAGVVSASPGILLGEESPSKAKVATTGRVKMLVDATKHPIRVGDLLVTGEKRGKAMSSQPVIVNGVKMHRPGTIVGKALEPLASGEGEILVLLSLQ